MEQKQLLKSISKIQWASGCCKSNCMVSSLAWAAMQWWRNSWQMHKILEHSYMQASALGRHWKLGLYPHIFLKCKWACKHPRIFQKWNNSLETTSHEKDGSINRPYFQSFIFGNEPWRLDIGYRSWRWNSKILESIPSKKIINIVKTVNTAFFLRNKVTFIYFIKLSYNYIKILWTIFIKF